MKTFFTFFSSPPISPEPSQQPTKKTFLSSSCSSKKKELSLLALYLLAQILRSYPTFSRGFSLPPPPPPPFLLSCTFSPPPSVQLSLWKLLPREITINVPHLSGKITVRRIFFSSFLLAISQRKLTHSPSLLTSSVRQGGGKKKIGSKAQVGTEWGEEEEEKEGENLLV